jgi:hypothetical protein
MSVRALILVCLPLVACSSDPSPPRYLTSACNGWWRAIHRKLAELAKAEGVSLNQLLSSAAAEKLAALMTEEYLAERAKRASRKKFDTVLAKVPKVVAYCE